MLTIQNINKIEGHKFKSGDWVIERAFEWQEQYIFYIESSQYKINPSRSIVSLSRKYNNESEQLYSLSKSDGKRIALGWTDIEDKDRLGLLIESMFEN